MNWGRLPSNKLRIALVVMLVGIWLARSLGEAHAEAVVQFGEMDVVYTYGEQATFHVTLEPKNQVSKVYLSLQPAGEDIRTSQVEFNASDEITYVYDFKDHYLRPFSRTHYWFQALLTNGQIVESPKQVFDYVDNRSSWQSLDNGAIQVNWLTGDLFYGQDALNAASAGAKAVLTIFPDQNLNGTRIFLYESSAAMREGLNDTPSAWAAGQASPDLGIIVVSIMPGIDQQLEMDRQIPHEMMHVALYQIVKDQIRNVPMWLSEGLSSMTETYPNPDYQRALNKAVHSQGSLLPVASLCSAFPQDASNAFLAYAESDSFVRFLRAKYGNSGLMALLQSYKNGISCEEGVDAALGSSLNQLEYRWQQESLGVDSAALALQNMLPFLLIVGLLMLAPLSVLLFTGKKG